MSVVRSPAPEAPDALIADLRTAEMYVVCAARLWVASYRGAEGAARDLARGFAVAGVPDDGLAALCRFFETVATTAARGLDIRCVRCPHLGADEALLLRAVSQLQGGQEHGAALLLADWMPAAGLRLAMAPLAVFAGALGEAGLLLPPRHGEALEMPKSMMGCSDRGVALVH